MEKYISLTAIRTERFEESLNKLGYVRSKVEAERLHITIEKLNKIIKEGKYNDTFVVNGVRYILAEPEVQHV